MHKDEFPRITTAVRDYLTIPTSEVAVKKLFSRGRDLLDVRRYSLNAKTIRKLILLKNIYQNDYYYYYSSNLRAHGVCDYGTLPIMRQGLSSYLTTYIYKYIRPYRMIFFCPVTVKLSNCLLRSRDSEC